MTLPGNSYDDAERALRMLRDAGYGSDVIPVIPFGAVIDAESKIEAKARGKAPGQLLANGAWAGLPHWQAIDVTDDLQQGWAEWHPSWGLRARFVRIIDIDEDDPTLCQALRKATEKQLLGTAPFRGRPGTPRGMLFYRAPAGAGRKIVIPYTHPDGVVAKVEILGSGSQARVWGQTETGWPIWENGSVFQTPWRDLPPADEKDIAELVVTLQAVLERHGCIVGARQGTAADGRFPLGHPDMVAADKNELADALRAIPNGRVLPDGTPNNFTGTYERVVAIVAAAVGGSGGDRGWINRHLVPWLRQWDGNDDAWIEARISSFDEGTSVGAETLYSFARGCGWQVSFAAVDGASEQNENTAQATPKVNAQIQTNAPFPAPGLLDNSATDMTLAERVANEVGPELALNGAGQWAVWNGEYRFVVDLNAVLHRIRRVVRLETRRLEGTEAQIANKAKWLEDERRARNILSVMAGAYIRTPFDLDPLVLNTPGGLVNLRNGRMRRAIPHDRVSMCTPVTPDFSGEPKLFLQTVLEIVSKDRGKLSLLIDWMALQLQGEHAIEKCLVLQGFGANGKSLLCDIIMAMLGHRADGGYGYATIRPDMFSRGRQDEARKRMADLQGVRAVLFTETPDNWKPDEMMLKGAISGEVAEARRMYGDPEMLTWTASLTFATNGRIQFEDAEHNLRRRIVFLQLRERFESNPEFRALVLAEAPRILGYMVTRLAELLNGRPSFWRPHTWSRADHLERAAWQAVEDETAEQWHYIDPIRAAVLMVVQRAASLHAKLQSRDLHDAVQARLKAMAEDDETIAEIVETLPSDLYRQIARVIRVEFNVKPQDTRVGLSTGKCYHGLKLRAFM